MEGDPGGIPFSRQNKTNRSPVWRAMLVVYPLVGKVTIITSIRVCEVLESVNGWGS